MVTSRHPYRVPILWDMVGPGQVTSSSQAVRARGAAGEQSAHGAESPGMHRLVAAPKCRRSRGNQCMPPPPGEDAVLHRRKRAGGADLAAPSSMVDPCDDVGEGGTTITNECQGARSRLVRAYRVFYSISHAKPHPVIPSASARAEAQVHLVLAKLQQN